jgi:L-ascorbate metabolism protein UlaG (beta-lactamase superfamily)
MQITKYQHACLVVEEAGEQLVIDPGVLAELPELSAVSAVLITHIHADHLHVPNLQKLAASNPDLTLYAIDEVLAELNELEVTKVTIQPGETVANGSLTLEFFGGEHEIIYQQVPCKNVGVLVNNTLYYPGDSYALPNKPVEIVAFPAAAPWLKVSEAIEFLKAVKPKRAFPTHNGTLSEFGEQVNYHYTKLALEEMNAKFTYLKVGEALGR